MEVEQPLLQTSTSSLNFGSTTVNETFSIRNSGSGTLSWTISEDKSWLSVSPYRGSTKSETVLITVNVYRSGLSPGSYSAQININSNGGNKVITVTMEVAAPPGKWLQYDDGNFESGFAVGGTGWLWMRFTRPSGWSSARVTKVKIYVKSGSSYSFDIDSFDDYNYSSGIYYPAGSYIGLKSSIRQSTGWTTHSVNHTFYSKQIFMAIWSTSESGPYLGNDKSKEIDLLSIDVEGFELEVLKSNNWNKYKPKIIILESNGTMSNPNVLYEHIDFLRPIGYKLEYFNGLNSIFKLQNAK
jgi:hypothetical protein